MAEKENKEIKRAIDTLDFISEDPKERERHNSIVMAEYNRLTSEHNFFEAGVEEGIKKGIEKGKKEGIIKIAKAMLEKNIPIETIMEITELTKEEIEKLK